MVLGNPPAELKVITPFVQRAKELTKIYPLISYYCLLQAANDGIKANVKTKECHNYLKELFDELELRKQNLSTEGSINSEENMTKAKLQITNLALNSFKKADDEDRSGNATKKTARTFHASSTFFEVLQCFGDLDEEIEKKIKYAKWKAADIMKAIREGRTPTPGSPSNGKNELNDDDLPTSSNEGINLNNNNMNGNMNDLNNNFGNMNINNNSNNYNTGGMQNNDPTTYNMSSMQNNDPTNYNMGGMQNNNLTNYNLPQVPKPQFNNDNDELNSLMNEMSPTNPSMNNNYNNNYPNNMNNYNQNYNNNNNSPMYSSNQQNNGYPNNNNNNAPMLPPRPQGGFDESMFPSTPTNGPGSNSNFSSIDSMNSMNNINNMNNMGSNYNNNKQSQSPYNNHNSSNNNIPNLPTVPKNTFKEDPFASSNSIDDDSYSDDEVDYPYDPAVLMDAQKHSRFAISALQYDDVQTAIKNLKIALSLLEPYQNIQGHK
ncbi:DUF605-domain-containing protein [Neocallimastix californiae]|jgi:vacuolar protein sorting-associated protein VTA1|uniref:DUF605-domain-containing protein n=2 Tax=Neocallimastix californiae TaxID=1754190 RepID=A0A1Y2CEE1_9FUNG|nr:DUF605-domain-containing protein [Neocallimastix californiae]|eukprot:ORY45409.1 DUF605-domain-containing protein [Neocallimastix californiae]